MHVSEGGISFKQKYYNSWLILFGMIDIPAAQYFMRVTHSHDTGEHCYKLACRRT